MATIKKSKKAKQPLGLRVIKIIVIVLCSAILLAAIVKKGNSHLHSSYSQIENKYA